MKSGISIINFGWFADIDLMVEVAVEAEQAGWDGFFLWDHLLMFHPEPVTPTLDPWIALAAIATRTKQIMIGPMVTAIPRRRPWKLARETVSLDHLSRGRLILGVGLGAPPGPEFEVFGEDSGVKTRAEKLDEGLSILVGLWTGEPFSHRGKHYQLDEMTFLPKPYQSPRIPIWVGGMWPNKAPMRRAAGFDGVVPIHANWPQVLTPEDMQEILSLIESQRGTLNGYDVVIAGQTTGNDASKDRRTISPWIDVGVTWWLESIDGMRGELDELRERIRLGPSDL